MVSLALSTWLNTTRPSRATATAEWSSWVRPESACNCSRAVSRSNGLVKRARPSARVWSAPTTKRPLMRAPPTRAFSRASMIAASLALCGPARASMARSSLSGATISRGTPAASMMARRAALFDASTSGSAASHSDISIHRLAAPLGQERDHGGCGLFDRTARDVDDWPVMLAAEAAREGDFLRHRLAVDILVVVAMRLEAEQAVLADLHDALRARRETDHQRELHPFELGRNRHAWHQRNVGGFHAAIGQIDRRRRLRGARHADQHDVRAVEIVRQLAVVMQHRVIERVDALEVFRIEHVLGAHPVGRLGAEIGLEQPQHRTQDRQAGQGGVARFLLPLP